MDAVLNHSSDQHPWFLESKSSLTNPKRNWYVWEAPRWKKDGKFVEKGTEGAVHYPPNNWESIFYGELSGWRGVVLGAVTESHAPFRFGVGVVSRDGDVQLAYICKGESSQRWQRLIVDSDGEDLPFQEQPDFNWECKLDACPVRFQPGLN
jgi:glycosidase